MKTRILLPTLLLLCSHFLSAQPVLDWNKSYNGGSNFTDKLVDIVVDDDCNTILTGQSDSIGTGIDIVTIKYDLDGNIVWKNRWDGAVHLDDIPTDLTIDQSGNIYLCGRTQSATTNFDYVTIKYLPDGSIASGWPAIYNNANANGNGADVAKSLCVNSLDSTIYVTGESYNHYASNSREDIFNIRYNFQGVILDTLAGLHSGNSEDIVREIGIDNVGRIFVTNFRRNTMFALTNDYTADLTTLSQWNNMVIGADVNSLTEFGIDQSNNKYLGIDHVNGFDLAKINGNNSIWRKSFTNTAQLTYHINSVAADNTGNTYIAANATNILGETDMWLLKMNTNGDTVWTKTWGNGNGNDDVPVKIFLASQPASIVVAANSTSSAGVSSIMTLRLDTAGNVLANYPLTFNTTTDVAVTATKDNNGNFFVGGYSGSFGSEDFTTLKYRTNSYQVIVGNVIGDSLYVTPAASSYQWYKDNMLLVNETNQGINIDTSIFGNGTYFCKISQYCSTFYSDTVFMTAVSLPENNEEGEMISISLEERNVVQIRYLENVEQGELSVFDVQGRVVAQEQVKNALKSSIHPIPFSKKAGIYFLRLETSRKKITRKFVLMQ